MRKRFHLAWFTNFTPGDWNTPFSHGGSPWDGKFFVEMAQAMERACFDYIILEDTLMVSEAYRGTTEAALKHVLQVPKHDPMPLAAMIAASTSRMGVVATMSTLAYPPFMLARLSATLDHISGGRFGWNIVTSGEDAAAQNFGLRSIRSISRVNSSSVAARSIPCRRRRDGQFSSKPEDRHAAGHLQRNMPIRSSPPQTASPGCRNIATRFARTPPASAATPIRSRCCT